jgi:GNAT superfamily N-acetyltransferase
MNGLTQIESGSYYLSHLGQAVVIMLCVNLDMLGSDPGYHGQGIGSRLLTWGVTQADELDVETFRAASPAGPRGSRCNLYEKFGFREAVEEILGGYVNTYMVRPAGGHV